MLHQLEVTIDLHKSKLYVKTKQKFSKDIHSFASKVDKRNVLEVNAFFSRSVERSERSSQVPNNP